MRIKTLLVFLTTFVTLSINAQCDVKVLRLDDKMTRYSMMEKFYSNEDLENGISAFYVSANTFRSSAYENLYVNSLVVTHLYSGSKKEFLPSGITIFLTGGVSNQIHLTAKEKSSYTINQATKAPEGYSTIEGIFSLTPDQVKLLLSNDIVSVIVRNSRTNQTQLITPVFKGILKEMFRCVINK